MKIEKQPAPFVQIFDLGIKGVCHRQAHPFNKKCRLLLYDLTHRIFYTTEHRRQIVLQHIVHHFGGFVIQCHLQVVG